MCSAKVLRVLVIGGCHTYGYGIEYGHGFVQRMITDWERSGLNVNVDYFAPTKIRKAVQLLSQHPELPSQYDLILLQLGHFELMARSFLSLFSRNTDYNNAMYGKFSEVIDKQLEPTDVLHLHSLLPDKDDCLRKKSLTELKFHVWSWAKSIFLRIYSSVKKPTYLEEVEEQLKQVSFLLKKYASRVVFISPFPTADPLTNHLRQWGGLQVKREAEEQGFGVLDLYELLSRNPDCLLADGAHLNEMGHYLVWLRLQKWLKTNRFDIAQTPKNFFNYQLHTN